MANLVGQDERSSQSVQADTSSDQVPCEQHVVEKLES